MKFIVAGYGFVGSTIGNVLSKQHEVVPVDPRLNNNKIKDHMVDCDGVIIAVSTPANKDGTANVKKSDKSWTNPRSSLLHLTYA